MTCNLGESVVFEFSSLPKEGEGGGAWCATSNREVPWKNCFSSGLLGNLISVYLAPHLGNMHRLQWCTGQIAVL